MAIQLGHAEARLQTVVDGSALVVAQLVEHVPHPVEHGRCGTQLVVAELGQRGPPARLVAGAALLDQPRGRARSARSGRRVGRAPSARGDTSPVATSPSSISVAVAGDRSAAKASSLDDIAACSRQAEQQAVLRVAELARWRRVSRPRSRRTAAIAPLNERPSWANGSSPGSTASGVARSAWRLVRRPERRCAAHAATASASVSRRRLGGMRPWHGGPPRSARTRTMHGMIASAARPADAQNAVP